MMLFIQSLQAQDNNKTTFETYLKTVYEAFSDGGWPSMKKYYSPTASEIDPQGNYTSGFENLELMYKQLYAMLEDKPKFTYTNLTYKMIKPDVVCIYWDARDEFVLKGGHQAKMEASCSAILVKQNSKWLIEHTQLTPKLAYADPAEDQAALRQLGKEAYAAFEARDAKKFASIYTEDVIFIGPNGSVALGRTAVEQMHNELFKQWENTKKLSSDITNNTFRMVSPEVVIIHWIDKSTYLMNGNQITETLAFSNTCVKKDGKWQSIAFSMTPVNENKI